MTNATVGAAARYYPNSCDPVAHDLGGSLAAKVTATHDDGSVDLDVTCTEGGVHHYAGVELAVAPESAKLPAFCVLL